MSHAPFPAPSAIDFMSQDRSQQPENPESQPLESQPDTVSSEFENGEVGRSLLTAQIIKLLRLFVRLLETAIARLETQPPISIPLPSWRTPAITAIALASFSIAFVLTSGKLTELIEIPAIQLPNAEIAEVPQAETSPPQTISPPSTELPSEEGTPLELTLPDGAVPVEISPPPIPVPTPEQNLIAAIQDRVAEIATEFTGGVIQSLKADFFSSLLVVKLSDSWYDLTPERQNQLANAMLQGAKDLDFTRLELTDPRSILLARSAIVGSKTIVIKRQK